MTPERWREVGDLFTRALDVPAAERRGWLDAAAASDEVKREVADLLAAHGSASGFLEQPPGGATGGAAPSALPTALAIGGTLGPYRILRLLGRGGMGVVVEAEDVRLHRHVALKAVSSLGGEGAEEERLRREARAAAALVHPNVATVYALEEIDGRAYLASEYLEGETLREVVGRGAVARDEALAVAHALASGLEAAHRRGIVHRDLKPENVLRLADGHVKILDFGLAHLDESQHRVSTRLVTLPGMAAGTPGYMAPEQLLGLAVDGRADQFALGVLLAELLTGAHPFAAPTLAATVARVLAADGVEADRAPLLPPDVAAVVHRCTRRRAEDRYPTIGEAAAAIAACQRHESREAIVVTASGAVPSPSPLITPVAATSGGGRSALWWWRFHQAAAAAIYWAMIAPAWIVHRQVGPPGLPWFLGCLAATIVAANVRLHLRFSAAVLPGELAAQRARTRGWVALADWALILLWAYAGMVLAPYSREWAVVFFAFAGGAALAVGLIEPATTRAAFAESRPIDRR